MENKAYMPLQQYQVEFKAASTFDVNEMQVNPHVDDPGGDQKNADHPDYDQDDDQDHPDDDDRNEADHSDDDGQKEDKVSSFTIMLS